MERVTENKINIIRERLLAWFKVEGREFPWRENNLTEYQLVIAETLLQRTKAETVSKFYLNFLREFPSWESLSKADIAVLEAYLRPLGLYTQRAKRLKDLAEEMVRRQGVLPRLRADLESIPFFGQYIANAIELIIFNKPMPLVDVNMARILERFFGKRKMADIRYDPYLQELASRVVAIPEAREINWAMLDFAALVCKARNPLCLKCPLNTDCTYFINK